MAARSRTKDWAPLFLEALQHSGMVTQAVKAAGISRRTAYARKARDAGFATAWEEAVDVATEQLEAEAVRRAIDGSDTLMIFLLKARRPEVYVERHQVRHALANAAPSNIEVSLEADGRKALASILRSRPVQRNG